jgi:cyclin-dependent kinase-like
MDDYESLCSIGEGTYGTVLKCRHKSSGMVVAVKRFKDSDKDELIRKTALREIKMLKVRECVFNTHFTSHIHKIANVS